MTEDGPAREAESEHEEGEQAEDAAGSDRVERPAPGEDEPGDPESEPDRSETGTSDESQREVAGRQRTTGERADDADGREEGRPTETSDSADRGHPEPVGRDADTGSRTPEGERAVGSEDPEGTDAVRSQTGPDEDAAPGPETGAGTVEGATAETDSEPIDDAEGSTEPVPDARAPSDDEDDVPEDVRSYDRFQKVDRASYDRVNEFLRDRTYVTAREWAIARLCADFRTATGVEMTKIGENLPELVPFMTDTYSPQAVNQARSAFERKVRMAGATFLYGAMSGFFTADELDDLMYEVTEVAKFLLEVEGVELTVDEELDAEDRISAVMREVRQASEELRFDEVACPHCGEAFQPAED